jgi:hypothetical protein
MPVRIRRFGRLRLPGSSGGSLGSASLRLKLLSEAHASTSVSSTVKCSSESSLRCALARPRSGRTHRPPRAPAAARGCAKRSNARSPPRPPPDPSAATSCLMRLRGCSFGTRCSASNTTSIASCRRSSPRIRRFLRHLDYSLRRIYYEAKFKGYQHPARGCARRMA